MSDPILLVVVLVVTLVLLVTQWVSTEIVGLGLVAFLGLSGLVSPEEAFSGFSSSATLTVGAMLVLSAGLEKTGAVDSAARRLARAGGGGDRRLLLALAVPTIAFSAFINNTPVVALMIPVAVTVARRFDTAPSKLLLPISALSILAGTCTLIGTSTNILVDSLAREHGGTGFGMFEFTGMGLIYLLVGGLYVVVVGAPRLPVRHALSEMLSPAGAGRFVTEVTIPSGSPLVGRPLHELVHGAERIDVLELMRGDEPFVKPDPDMPLQAGDALILETTAKAVRGLLGRPGVERGTAVADTERVALAHGDLRMAEAVITPNSRLRERRVKDLGLARRLSIQILAVRRFGRQHQVRVREWRLHAGDVLLVLGPPASLRGLQDEDDVLLLAGVDGPGAGPRKALAALAILLGVVLLASLGVASIAQLAVAGAALMLVTGCLAVRDATRALEPSVLLLLVGTIPLGLAMQRTGLAADLAGAVAGLAGPHGPVVLMSALYLVTSLLTEVLSNNATAVLLTPIALGLAAEMGVDAKPLLVAVAFGASASFATPIGYQTNLLVMGPGGYRFADYLRFGVPLNVIMWIAATVLIPVFWSF